MTTRFRIVALALLIAAAPLVHAESIRYLVRPVYSSVGFSIVKWGVLNEQGIFRDFRGTLDYDPEHPERSRIDVVVDAASLDTKEEGRDKVVRSDDFLDVARYPTLEFHGSAIAADRVGGNLTIHGITRPVSFPVIAHGIRSIPNVGDLAGFETAFTINRRDFHVLGNRWGAVPGVLSDEVEIHIVIGAVRPKH